jgi:hypothetical protein
MCDYCGKLIAWLDRELPADEAVEVQHHLRECVECGERLEKYRQVSSSINEYCIAVATTETHNSSRRLVPVLARVAAAVIVATLGISVVRTHLHSDPAAPALAAQPVWAPRVMPSPAPKMVAATNKPVRRQHMVRPRLPEAQNWMPPAPAIQVAISADAVFPPGAVPEGVSFTADVNIGPDGLAQQIRFRPLLAGLERRTTQP